MELTQIVKNVQEDIGQFELLHSRIVNKVYYWCLTVVGNETEAKDVAQEVMIRVYRKLHTLKNPETFNTWLYVMARNLSYNHIKANSNKNISLENEDEFLTDVDINMEEKNPEFLPKESYDLKESKMLIGELIQKLPRKQKEVIVLYYLQDFNSKEIAEILDCSDGSVRSRLHEGRKGLEKLVMDYEEKKGIKLYGGWLPMLGPIVKDHCEVMSARQNLSYDKKLYESNKVLRGRNIKKFIASNMKIIIFCAIGLGIIVAVAIYGLAKSNHEAPKSLLIANLDDIEKLGKDSLIQKIEYPTFIASSPIKVSVTLKGDINKEQIKIEYKEEELKFNKDKGTLTFQANENGNYSIIVKGKETVFTIENIEKNAPKLIDVKNRGSHLNLVFKGETSKLNLSKSQVEYQGKKYEIDSDFNVKGSFSNSVLVILYDENNQYIEYRVEIN